ncbi:triose-phosphate isomerase [Roseivirga sp.]|uniref:triose-phosphate isomerase n=1 Tax=Roseivirga sp. TaxID=1964215 RepID=UPI003B8C20DE
MRKKIIAGNWKMNKNLEDGIALASEVVNIANDETPNDVTVVMCTPAIHLSQVSGITANSDKVFVGAQNMSEHESGAYTGDLAADMITSTGASYVIIGHSERREYHFETNQQLAARVKLALAKGLTPLFCCGESLEIREAGKHVEFVTNQLSESLYDLSSEDLQKVVIAYEPIWAIGTGVTASAEQAQDMHKSLRASLADRYSHEVAEEISILYGGSMKPSNAQELLSQPDVDGGLIGGASLKSRDFIDITKSY